MSVLMYGTYLCGVSLSHRWRDGMVLRATPTGPSRLWDTYAGNRALSWAWVIVVFQFEDCVVNSFKVVYKLSTATYAFYVRIEFSYVQDSHLCFYVFWQTLKRNQEGPV